MVTVHGHRGHSKRAFPNVVRVRFSDVLFCVANFQYCFFFFFNEVRNVFEMFCLSIKKKKIHQIFVFFFFYERTNECLQLFLVMITQYLALIISHGGLIHQKKKNQNNQRKNKSIKIINISSFFFFYINFMRRKKIEGK